MVISKQNGFEEGDDRMGFKPGNIVKKIDTYWHGDLNESKDDIGKLYVIEYSYVEKYGNGSCYGGYSIIDMETGGSSAWWRDSCLEFIEEGSINLITQLKEKRNQLAKSQQNINWIKDNFKYSLPANSILALFHKVEYNSTFEKNGEYYTLMVDWMELYPIFKALFEKNKSQMIKLIGETFVEKYKETYINNFSKLYDEIVIA